MRVINYNCLYCDVTAPGDCLGESNEHVIQEGIGGRYERPDVICHACNEELGTTIDQSLSSYYACLIDILRVMMPSRFRKYKRSGRSAKRNVPLIHRPGGSVEIGKLHREFNPDGSLKAINAPYDYDAEQLRNIARNEGMSGSLRIVHVPITELDESALSKIHCSFNEKTHRAAAKAILEVVDIQTRDLGLKHYARLPAMKGVRNYIRNGIFTQYSGRTSCPMYYLDEEFDVIFGSVQEDRFANRVVFCNDSIHGYCYGFMQIAHTIPLGLCFGPSVDDKDFSLIYEASLVGYNHQKQDRTSKWVEGVLISQTAIRWASFVARTSESVSFAHCTMRRSVSRQMGRAQILVDMKCDNLIAGTLRQYAIDAVTRGQMDVASKNGLLRAICEPLLRVQFQHNNLSAKDWDEAFSLHELPRLDAQDLVKNLRTNGTMEPHVVPVLSCFRQILRHLINIDGYPDPLVSLAD